MLRSCRDGPPGRLYGASALRAKILPEKQDSAPRGLRAAVVMDGSYEFA